MKITLLPHCLLGAALLLAFNTPAQVITRIASADGVSFFVKSDGSLWRGDAVHAMARHNERMQRLLQEMKQHPRSNQAFDQLRQGSEHMLSANFTPDELIVSNGITAVALNGQQDTFFVKTDGSLWAMGNNEGGYLGDGTTETPDHPIQLVPAGVVAVACGEAFTLFLKTDGSVWGFGWNGDGPLGDGTQSTLIERPKQLVSGGVAAIAAGSSHSLFLKRDGSLWVTGMNQFGQLGLGTNVAHVLQPVALASNVVSMAAAHGHSLFIKRDGSLWAMGLNEWGQLGNGTINWGYRPEQVVSNQVVAVTAGESGSLFLKQDGSLWAMGLNWGSDYGEGIEFNAKCPTQLFAGTNTALVAGAYYNAQLKSYASLWAGKFNLNPATVGPAGSQAAPAAASLAAVPGSNRLTIEALNDGNVRLTYSGQAGVGYTLERASSLAHPTWVPLLTNTAPSGGVLVITNTPDRSMNNFWRMRSVP